MCGKPSDQVSVIETKGLVGRNMLAGFLAHQCVLRNTLAGSKPPFLISRNNPFVVRVLCGLVDAGRVFKRRVLRVFSGMATGQVCTATWESVLDGGQTVRRGAAAFS